MYSSPKKTNSDYYEYLTNSIERSRIIAQMEQESKTAQLQRSTERSRIQADLANQSKAAEIQRSIERSRIQAELENSSRLAQLESESKSAQLQRSIERMRLQTELANQSKAAELQRSMERSRIQAELDPTNRLAQLESEAKIARLERSLGRSRISAELDSASKIAQLQRSIDRNERYKSIEREETRRTLEQQAIRNRILEEERLSSLGLSTLGKSFYEREEIRRTLEQQAMRNQILEEERLGSLGLSNLGKSLERSRIMEKSRLIVTLEEKDRLNQTYLSIEREQELRDLERLRLLQEIETSENLMKYTSPTKLRELERIEREQKLRDLERLRVIQEIEAREMELKLESPSKLLLERSRVDQLRELERLRIIQDIDEQQRINKYVSPLRYTGYKSVYPTLGNEPLRYTGYQSVYANLGNEEEQLVRALKAQVEINREIEDTKNQLALKPDFNLLDAFKIFDANSRGYCTKLEFQTSLNDVAIFPSSDELYLYFKRLDKDQDGLLRYSEFTRAILPFQQEYLDLMNNRQPADPNNLQGFSSFTEETRYLFKQLLNKEINGEREAELIRQLFTRRPLFSINDAFGAIDADKNGFISITEFQRLFNDYGFFVSATDLASLVDRYDKNQDGKVSYGEFLSEMTPKSPQKYY